MAALFNGGQIAIQFCGKSIGKEPFTEYPFIQNAKIENH